MANVGKARDFPNFASLHVRGRGRGAKRGRTMLALPPAVLRVVLPLPPLPENRSSHRASGKEAKQLSQISGCRTGSRRGRGARGPRFATAALTFWPESA